MYQASDSDRQSKGMKVKHLVQLVTLTVLFTWLLYQLNSSHNVKIASLRLKVDNVDDDGAGLDDANSFLDIDSGADQVQVGDEILSRSSFRRKNIKPTELREVEREENNEEVDELEQVGDEGDDSGEGDGDEDAVNLVDKEEHVRNVEEIESEDAIPGGILIEEADSLEQPGQFHSSLSDSTS